MTSNRYDTTVRLDKDLARRLRVIAQVLEVSVNKLMESSLTETAMFYENDADFQKQHKAWLQRQKL